MKAKEIFYHVICKGKARISIAEQNGIKSVPALLLDKNIFHNNLGASLDDVKGV